MFDDHRSFPFIVVLSLLLSLLSCCCRCMYVCVCAIQTQRKRTFYPSLKMIYNIANEWHAHEHEKPRRDTPNDGARDWKQDENRRRNPHATCTLKKKNIYPFVPFPVIENNRNSSIVLKLACTILKDTIQTLSFDWNSTFGRSDSYHHHHSHPISVTGSVAAVIRNGRTLQIKINI